MDGRRERAQGRAVARAANFESAPLGSLGASCGPAAGASRPPPGYRRCCRWTGARPRPEGARGGCGSGAAVQTSGTSNRIPVASSDRREVTVAFPTRVRSQCSSQHLPPPTDPGSGRSLEYQLSTNISAVFEEKGRCRSDVPVRRGNGCSELEDRSRRAATLRKIVIVSSGMNILSRCKLY